MNHMSSHWVQLIIRENHGNHGDPRSILPHKFPTFAPSFAERQKNKITQRDVYISQRSQFKIMGRSRP